MYTRFLLCTLKKRTDSTYAHNTTTNSTMPTIAPIGKVDLLRSVLLTLPSSSSSSVTTTVVVTIFEFTTLSATTWFSSLLLYTDDTTTRVRLKLPEVTCAINRCVRLANTSLTFALAGRLTSSLNTTTV